MLTSIICIIEGSLEVKLPKIWTHGKAEVGRVREEKRRGEERREEKESEERRCRMQAREKVEKAWNTVLFQWFVAKEGWKVGSLKRRMRSHLRPDERWTMARHCGAKHISKSKHVSLGTLLKAEMSKKCTPLWREAHFKVKTYKTHQLRTIFGSWDVEKVHALWPEAHFQVKMRKAHQLRATSGSWIEVDMSKKCTPLWREAHFKVKTYKTHQLRTIFGSWDVEKVHALWPEAHFQVKMRKAHQLRATSGSWIEVDMSKKCKSLWWEGQDVRTTFGRSDVVSPGRHKGFCTLSKVSKTWGFWDVLSHFQKQWQARGIWRGSGQMHFAWKAQYSRHMRYRKARNCRWPGITFSWQVQYFTQVEWKNRKTQWYYSVSSALNVPFLRGVSQNCFVFDLANFKNWGRLSELLRFWRYQCQKLRKSRRNCGNFWCCQIQKLRKSRRIASFSSLQIDR